MTAPSNLVPTAITDLPVAPVPTGTGTMIIVIGGVTYQAVFNDVLGQVEVPATRSINAGGGLTGGGNLTQDRTLAIANGGVDDTKLSTTGVAAGTYGSATEIPQIVVNAQGRITGVTLVSPSFAGLVPDSRQIIAGTGLSGGGNFEANRTIEINFSNATPQALGSATAGVGTQASRDDHVHPPVDLADANQRTGILGIANGGTGENITNLTAGAVLYSDGVGLVRQSAQGTIGQILTSNGAGAPYWQTISGTGTVTSVDGSGGTTGLTLTGGPITTVGTLTLGGTLSSANGGTGVSSYSAGDLLYYAAGTALNKLGIGSSTYVLTSSGTAPTWSNPTSISVGTAANLANGATNQIPYQTGSGATGFITAPTVANTYLEWSGSAFQWSANPLGSVTSVDVSGGTTGLTTSGGPITSSGTITIAGTLAVANGGTGATDAATARTNLSAAASGANADITSMTGLTGGISSPDFVQFDATATVTDATAKLYYNNADQFKTLAFQMNGSVIQKIGEEQYFRVKCQGSITKGQVVSFANTVGASGGLIGKAATGLTADQSNYILGIAAETGANNDWIFVTYFGEVKGIDTTGGAESWVQGQVLYYDPTVTGGLTKTKPTTPNAIAVIAAVVYVSASNGILFIRPTYGSVLGGTDGNVQFGTLNNGDVIVYDGTDQRWENVAQSTLAVGTATNVAGGGANQIVYNTAAGTSNFITAPTVGDTFLKWNGSAFAWDVAGAGTVTSVTASSPLASSGGSTPDISLTGTIATTNGGLGANTFTAGDLVYYSTGTAFSKLAIGTSTYLLTSSGTAPQWSDPSGVTVGAATTATNLAGGDAGKIPYQSAAGTTLFSAAGSTGEFLISGGTGSPTWTATISGGTYA